MSAAEKIVLEVNRYPSGSYGLAIYAVDESDAGYGYRISGGKLGATSAEVVHRHELSARDAAQIGAYLRTLTPDAFDA